MVEILLWAVALGLPFGALVGFGLERQLVRLLIAKAAPEWRTAIKLRDSFYFVVPEAEYTATQILAESERRRRAQPRGAKGRFGKKVR